MRRARQQLVVAAVVACAAPGAALAYHNGKVFDRAPGAGGAGGLFYTGSRRDRGWDCTACHVAPRGRLRVDVTSQPPELFANLTYRPGTSYTIAIAMADPAGQLGLSATRSNYNGIAISMLDDAGVPAGMIGGFDPAKFYARGSAILASDSTTTNETSWTLTWTAPPAGTGAIAIDLGVVDGDGAHQTGTSTLTDPLGDDTAMSTFVVVDATAGAAAVRAPPRRAWWVALLVACPILSLAFARRRRR